MNCPLCNIKADKLYPNIYRCSVCDAEIIDGTASGVTVTLLSKDKRKAQYRDIHTDGCFAQAYEEWEGNIWDYHGDVPGTVLREMVTEWWQSKAYREIKVEVV